MKLSNLNPQQEFILKTLRFNPEMYIEIKNHVPRMYLDGYTLFHIKKATIDNLLVLGLIKEKNEKYTINTNY